MSKKPRFSPAVKKQTLAEQVAEAVQESILAGEWQGGEALPTEPDLAEQFGVSRAVIRDATRMLAAQGMVAAQHGKGVFVTKSQTDAFGEALLLALRRDKATAWDVEQFEQLLYPEVAALAAREATEAELQAIRQVTENYLAFYEAMMREKNGADVSEQENEQLRVVNRQITKAIFLATHNKLLILLVDSITRLRNLRHWEDVDEETAVDQAIAMETQYLHKMVDTIATRDPDHVRTVVREMMMLPPQAEKAMRQTAVGEVPLIPRP